MDLTLSSWFLILLALAAANLPFVNERLFAALPLPGGQAGKAKPFFWRLLELLVLYFVVGGIGILLEGRMGNVFPQNWEFYAVTGCLFIVLAYPGFVVRYLRRERD